MWCGCGCGVVVSKFVCFSGIFSFSLICLVCLVWALLLLIDLIGVGV